MINMRSVILIFGFLYLSLWQLYGQHHSVKELDSFLSNTMSHSKAVLINGKDTTLNQTYNKSMLDSPKWHKVKDISLRGVDIGKIDTLILKVMYKEDVRTYLYKQASFSILQQQLDDLINEKIQKGYLRAFYQYDTLTTDKARMTIHYSINLGRRYVIDSIKIHRSTVSLNLSFIQNYLRKYFSNGKVVEWKEIAEQIKYIDFIEMEKNPDFTIRDTSATFNLYLKERKLNQINAIMGILTNAYNSNELEITGDVKLGFVNILKQGISFDLNWQKNLTNSQFLYSKFNFPFLFNTKIGTSGLFNIEKFDSSYLRIQYQFGLNYYIQYSQVVSFFYRKNNSTIIGFNKLDVLNGKLPEHLDFTTDEFGFGYKVEKLNRPLFTKRGWSLETNFLLGNKTTSINSKISELTDGNGISLAKLYNKVPLSQLTISFLIDANRYTPLGRDWILKTRVDSRAWITETVSTGEMYYIGGNKLPRGYDDNNFIVPWYVNFSNEIQYYLSEYFYSNIFVDMAYLKNSLSSKTMFPLGLGGGLTLKTKDNIFRLNMGTGYLGESRFTFGSIKVHINYISVF